MRHFYKITTDANYRPGHEEDNSVIIAGHSMLEALSAFKDNRGKMLVTGNPISCVEVHYVYTTFQD